MNLIVNADKNWGIGKNNELLVHIPNDMKMFRQMTTGKVVVMGRKTLESFPNGMPLPKRTQSFIGLFIATRRQAKFLTWPNPSNIWLLRVLPSSMVCFNFL